MKKILVIILTLNLLACTKKGNDTIKVGEVNSLTGNDASFGVSTHRGIEMAVNEINSAGGIEGKKIELITLDDQGKPEEAAIAITKLITQEKVITVLGEVASSRSLAMAPIAQQYKIPMLSPSSTNPKVTMIGDYIFRASFIDPFQGKVMARFALDYLKIKKVAVFKDIKNDYSLGLSEFFIKTFAENGGEIVVEQSYSSGDIDFKSQLTAIKSKNPQAIFLPGYYTETALIARQARELGIKVPFLGGDGWDSPKLTEIARGALDGSYHSSHYSAENQNPKTISFNKKFNELYGVVPDAMAATGYDAAYLLAHALKKSSNTNPEKIRDALAQTKDLEGITGKITLDENRNPTKSAVILKVENNVIKYHSTIDP
ncbi:MAG: ABC transporter substrate-binding protein [Bacteriovoracaceae bacterium]|nr:ABC transporter substrate-binding protein [Bacteriovoracaceae bacterium]